MNPWQYVTMQRHAKYRQDYREHMCLQRGQTKGRLTGIRTIPGNSHVLSTSGSTMLEFVFIKDNKSP